MMIGKISIRKLLKKNKLKSAKEIRSDKWEKIGQGTIPQSLTNYPLEYQNYKSKFLIKSNPYHH